jgi:hypothetical protein
MAKIEVSSLRCAAKIDAGSPGQSLLRHGDAVPAAQNHFKSQFVAAK